MARFLGRHDPSPRRLRQCFECCRPAPLAGFERDQAQARPARIRAQQKGALGKPERRAPVALAHRLVEQAAQAQKLGLRPVEHQR